MQYSAMHCTVLHCTALHCTVVHITALHWTQLPNSAVQSRPLATSIRQDQPAAMGPVAPLPLLLPLLLLLLAPLASCLLLQGVRVPPLTLSGSDATLHCDFDTQHEELYSVKWYKGGHEVFRSAAVCLIVMLTFLLPNG